MRTWTGSSITKIDDLINEELYKKKPWYKEIHQVERTYGSTVDTPVNDEHLLQARKQLLEHEKKRRHRDSIKPRNEMSKLEKPKSFNESIWTAFKSGLTDSRISKTAHLGLIEVREIILASQLEKSDYTDYPMEKMIERHTHGWSQKRIIEEYGWDPRKLRRLIRAYKQEGVLN